MSFHLLRLWLVFHEKIQVFSLCACESAWSIDALRNRYNCICVYAFVRQVSLSDARNVTLLDVQKQLTGFFKCEVSADAPLFHTEIKSASMTVVGK